VLPDNMATDV